MRYLPKTALEVAALLPSTFEVVHTQDISTHHQITVRGESERAVMDALTVATRTLHETQVWVGAKLDGWRRNHQWQGTFILTDKRVAREESKVRPESASSYEEFFDMGDR